MENQAEAKIPSPVMSETFGNQSKPPVVEKRIGLLKKVLGLFRRKKEQTTPPSSAESLQQKANAVQERLNEVNQGMAVDKQSGVPTGDAQTIAQLEQKKGDLAAVGVTPSVGPVEPKMEFSTPPLPEFQKPGSTPTAVSTESLAAEVAKLTQADAKSEEVVPPIAETAKKAA